MSKTEIPYFNKTNGHFQIEIFCHIFPFFMLFFYLSVPVGWRFFSSRFSFWRKNFFDFMKCQLHLNWLRSCYKNDMFFCHWRWSTIFALVYALRLLLVGDALLYRHATFRSSSIILTKPKNRTKKQNGKEIEKWRKSHHVVCLYLFDRKLICKCASNANRIPIKLTRQMPSIDANTRKVQKFFQRQHHRLIKMRMKFPLNFNWLITWGAQWWLCNEQCNNAYRSESIMNFYWI